MHLPKTTNFLTQPIAFISQYKLGVTFALVLCVLALSFVIPLPSADLNSILAPPSFSRWLGTDLLGNNILSRILVGIRYSIVVSLVTVSLTVLLGTAISLLIVANKILHTPVHIFVNMLIAIPPFVICLLLIAHYGGGTRTLILGQTLAFLPVCIRLAYSELSQVLQSEYAKTAIGLGHSPSFVARKHGFATLIPKLRAQMLSLLAVAIGIESGLSYLGLGPSYPQVGLGQLLYESINYWSITPGYPLATFASFSIMLGIIASLLSRLSKQT